MVGSTYTQKMCYSTGKTRKPIMSDTTLNDSLLEYVTKVGQNKSWSLFLKRVYAS